MVRGRRSKRYLSRGKLARAGRVACEMLERRCLLSQTITVTNTNNSGSGSLNAAITEADSDASAFNPVTIGFSIDSAITPTSPLPEVDSYITINGGAGGVTLSGASAPDNDALQVTGSNVTIEGLIIEHFTGAYGLEFDNDSNISVQSCNIGSNGKQESFVFQGYTITEDIGGGIYLNSVQNATIGDDTGTTGGNNFILQNGTNGITISNSTNVVVGDNTIQLNALDGVEVTGSACSNITIGTTTPPNPHVPPNTFSDLISQNGIGVETDNGANDVDIVCDNFGYDGYPPGTGHDYYGNAAEAVLFNTNGNEVTESNLSGSAGNGLAIYGNDNTASYDQIGAQTTGVNQGYGVICDGNGNAISRCSIYYNGEGGIDLDGATTAGNTIEYDEVENSGGSLAENDGQGLVDYDDAPDTITSSYFADNATYGIELLGSGASVENCLIGTEDGVTAAPNAVGVYVAGTDNTIGGGGFVNVISGNTGDGIDAVSATDALIIGNDIGTTVTGEAPLANGGNDISVTGGTVTIGAVPIAVTGLGDANVIGASINGDGVELDDTSSSVLGNYIGINSEASVPGGTTFGTLGNNTGISVTGAGGISDTIQGNYIDDSTEDGIDYSVPQTGPPITNSSIEIIGNDIGGTVASNDYGSGNVGVRLSADNALVQGNTIEDNMGGGIVLSGSSDDTIGGSVASDGNTVSANEETGIAITSGNDDSIINNTTDSNALYGISVASGTGNPVSYNTVEYNESDGIACAAGGTTFIDNTVDDNTGDGIYLTSSDNNVLDDTIFQNGDDGVAVVGNTSVGNIIRVDIISENGELGIDLGGSGTMLSNTPGAHTSGPNLLQNYPILNQLESSGTGDIIMGSLNSGADSQYTIDFYGNGPTGEGGLSLGQTYLGSETATTNSSGNATFSFATTGALPVGVTDITATATDSSGDTSEFDNPLLVSVVAQGKQQRSEVQQLTIDFPVKVTLAPGAFSLSLHPNGTVNGKSEEYGTVPTITVTPNSTDTSYTITFSGAGVVNGSIADGMYDLALNAADVSGLTLGSNQIYSFFRLFGDADGNGAVNNADYARFKEAFGATTASAPNYNAAFDYYGNGYISNADYAQFKARFGTIFSL